MDKIKGMVEAHFVDSVLWVARQAFLLYIKKRRRKKTEQRIRLGRVSVPLGRTRRSSSRSRTRYHVLQLSRKGVSCPSAPAKFWEERGHSYLPRARIANVRTSGCRIQ